MPADAFSQRLDLLEASDQLSPETRHRVETLVGRIEAELGVELSEERGAMFVTHVAIAWEKLSRGTALPSAPQNLIDEVAPYTRERSFLQEAFHEIAGPGEQLPPDELAFWTVHLAAVQ